jgi:hypothetical protein
LFKATALRIKNAPSRLQINTVCSARFISSGWQNVKHSLVALTVICSVAALACAPRAEAGGHGIRADLPCPYGAAGPPNPDEWSPVTPTPSIPFNPGAPTANSAVLVAGSNITTDDLSVGYTITGATQYDWFTNPIPDVSTGCPDPTSTAPQPVEQVIDYTLAAGQTGPNGLPAAATEEVVFNYDSSLKDGVGTASFTLGGSTFTSLGGILPTTTDNDFIFGAGGVFLGSINTGNPANLFSSAIPDGWACTGSCGGTVAAAPEIDSASSIAAFTLLAGGLAVLRGRRKLIAA